MQTVLNILSYWTQAIETGLAVGDCSHEKLPLRDATSRQFLDHGGRSWKCNAPLGHIDSMASVHVPPIFWYQLTHFVLDKGPYR